ncbi:MAG TPA: response regulator [Polyangia bacterium]
MDEYSQWLLAGVSLCLLAGWLGYRVFKRANAKRSSTRAIDEAAARAVAQRTATEEAGRQEANRRAAAQEAARAAAGRLAEAKVARVEVARLAAEEASRAAAARLVTEAAARAEAARLAAEEAACLEVARDAAQQAARAEAARVAVVQVAHAHAARLAVEEAARAEVVRLAAEEAARAQAVLLAFEEAALVQTAREAAEKAAHLEAERQAIVLASVPQAPTVAAKTPEQTLVMVADDSKIVRVKTGRLLARHQYRVFYATDGLDAAQRMRTSIPDVVITDVDMPGMDGFELTRHVRKNPLTAHIPIIMITAADDRHREDADRAGVSVLLGKPYLEEELIDCIRSAMQHRESPAGALV